MNNKLFPYETFECICKAPAHYIVITLGEEDNNKKGFSMPPSDIALDFDCIPVEVIDEEQEEQEREDEEDIVETWDGREADEDWVDTWLYRDGD